MDNRTLDVTSLGDEDLALALKLVWPNAHGGKATHYKIVNLKEVVDYVGQPTSFHTANQVPAEDGKPTLILFWSAEKDALPLPYPLDLDGSTDFVKGWLKNVDAGEEPDHDGDNKLGWRVFNEQWGYVAGYHQAIVGVQPAWAMFGK